MTSDQNSRSTRMTFGSFANARPGPGWQREGSVCQYRTSHPAGSATGVHRSTVRPTDVAANRACSVASGRRTEGAGSKAGEPDAVAAIVRARVRRIAAEASDAVMSRQRSGNAEILSRRDKSPTYVSPVMRTRVESGTRTNGTMATCTLVSRARLYPDTAERSKPVK